MTDFVLASGSPRRRLLLEGLGIVFTVIKPDVDEAVRPGERPEGYVLRLSQEKATQIADRLYQPAYVLAADTTVIHNGDILGKPEDEDDARRMLLRLRGQMHRVCTGFTLLYVEDREALKSISEVVCTDVMMRNYSASEMERWVMGGHAFDKAGGYAIQSTTFPSVEKIDGSYDNVVGLPTEAVSAALARIGYTPPSEFETGGDI